MTTPPPCSRSPRCHPRALHRVQLSVEAGEEVEVEEEVVVEMPMTYRLATSLS